MLYIHIKLKYWLPIKMLRNVSVKLTEMVSNIIAHRFAFVIGDTGPWARKVVWCVWRVSLVAHVDSAPTFHVSFRNMVASCSDVGEDSGAKATLVRDNHVIKHVSHVMPWLS